MPEPEPSPHPIPAQADERGAALALLPVAATVDYYALPDWLQQQTLVQFAPQLIAYLTCALWIAHNSDVISRLGLDKHKLLPGLHVGWLIGLGLGCLNSLVILKLFPMLGFDISFLKATPHARLPVLVMIPWFICLIAVFVEVNFRGFLLGRLLALCRETIGAHRTIPASALAVAITSLVFSFDPFMTNTFHHLHWIAVWDGAVWAASWIATKNLYVPIAAHAVEVMVLYSAVRTVLMSET